MWLFRGETRNEVQNAECRTQNGRVGQIKKKFLPAESVVPVLTHKVTSRG